MTCWPATRSAVVEAIGARGLGSGAGGDLHRPDTDVPPSICRTARLPGAVAVKAHHTAAARAPGGPAARRRVRRSACRTGLTTRSWPPPRGGAGRGGGGQLRRDMTEPGVVRRQPGQLCRGRTGAVQPVHALAATSPGRWRPATSSLRVGEAGLRRGACPTAVSDCRSRTCRRAAYRPLLTERPARWSRRRVPPMPGRFAQRLPGSLDGWPRFNRARPRRHTGSTTWRSCTVHRGARDPRPICRLAAAPGGDLSAPSSRAAAPARGEPRPPRCLRAPSGWDAPERVVSVIARRNGGGRPLAGRPVGSGHHRVVAATRCGSPATARSRPGPMRRWWPGSGPRARSPQPVPGVRAGFAHPQVGDTAPGIPPNLGWVLRRFGRAGLGGACALALGTDTGRSIRIPARTAASPGSSRPSGLLPVAGSSAVTGCDHVARHRHGPAPRTAASPADPGTLRPPPPGGGSFTRRRPAATAHPSLGSRRGCTGRSGRRWPCWRRPAAAREIADPWLAELPRGRTPCRHRLRGGGGRAPRPGPCATPRGNTAPSRVRASVTSGAI